MKNAIITGAHGDIGFGISERLAKKHWNLILISKSPIEEARIRKLQSYRVDVDCFTFDLMDKNKLRNCFTNLMEKNIEVHALINNAGIYPIVPVEKYSEELWDTVINVNLTAAFRCTLYSIPLMKASGGRIVNISSTGAHLGSRDPGYAASKAGLIGLTKSLSKTLGKYNILVNAIAPGMIDSRMSRRMKKVDRLKNIETSPLKRAGKIEDVVGAVDFLLSDDSSFITGATIDVNGGIYLR